MSFGDDGGDLTYEEIGQLFNFTKARIDAVEKKAIRRLQNPKQPSEAKELLRFLQITNTPELRELLVIMLIVNS